MKPQQSTQLATTTEQCLVGWTEMPPQSRRHVCKLLRGHHGRHECLYVRATGQLCRARRARKRK